MAEIICYVSLRLWAAPPRVGSTGDESGLSGIKSRGKRDSLHGNHGRRIGRWSGDCTRKSWETNRTREWWLSVCDWLCQLRPMGVRRSHKVRK